MSAFKAIMQGIAVVTAIAAIGLAVAFLATFGAVFVVIAVIAFVIHDYVKFKASSSEANEQEDVESK